MEVLTQCKTVDFGSVRPGKVIKKKLKVESNFLIKSVQESSNVHPLERAFAVKQDSKSDVKQADRYIAEFDPALPHHKYFGYFTVKYEDDTSEMLFLKGETKGPEVKLSTDKISFITNFQVPVAQYTLKMTNDTDCDDYFLWDIVPDDSYVTIMPHFGTMSRNSSREIVVTYHPKSTGLFFLNVACLFKYQEPKLLNLYALHSESRMKKVYLEKYIQLGIPFPVQPTNYCQYFNDIMERPEPERRPPILFSQRYINFKSVPMVEGRKIAFEEFSLTNNTERDLMLIWEIRENTPFAVEPVKALLPAAGTAMFLASFCPKTPEVFSYNAIYASLRWGINLEYSAPFVVRVSLIGDSFSHEQCGWGPAYSIERTRIILPGTIPNLPAYTAFQITRTGPLPLQFSLEPINHDRESIFTVKPQCGLIRGDFQIILVQLFPGDKVDVLFQEEWLLTINKFAKVKLEFCGSCELPHVLAGDNKTVRFPSTTVGAISYLDVPIKNPTRLELEYQCKSENTGNIEVSHDKHRIGPGEQQFVNFGFKAEKLGTFAYSQGIILKWTPYHSAVLKSLKGKAVHTETIVLLNGTVETASIYAQPSNIVINNVFLHDWGITNFFIHNSGNCLANVRLKCKVVSRFSDIGKWRAEPNDISIEPHQSVEVKLHMFGKDVGLNSFVVEYRLYANRQFQKATTEWQKLLDGRIYVFFLALKVIDIRYEGLAKSLSKHTLWSLLEINRLNEFFANLDKDNEYDGTMKVPEYHEVTPTLKIDLLVKNICPVTLHMNGRIEKYCHCLPQKKDTISRRIVDYSCLHDHQLRNEFSSNEVKPDQTIILSLVLNYDEADECRYAMTLFITRLPEKKPIVSARIEVDRGIIPTDIAALDFLLPGPSYLKTFAHKLEDVFIGDNNRYFQVIWMCNHSQSDCRYWCEWLYVNNRIFKILNSKALVPAYSSRPLFIEFVPYEFTNYDALLAVVNEQGQEFHLLIEGHGSIVNDLTTKRMLRMTPPIPLFNNIGPELELSIDHIALRPMPTHSFDKFLFFLKNNSPDVISFRWERFEIWSTVRISVLPKRGEIEPGEVFALQMHIHTFRFPAIFNFAIECFYYSKRISETYWKNSQIMKQMTRIFDSCFVLIPDKEIEIAYRNPHYKASAGPAPQNKIIAVGGSMKIFKEAYFASSVPSLQARLKYLPPPKLVLNTNDHSNMMSNREYYGTVNIIKDMIRKVVDSEEFQDIITAPHRPTCRYVDLPKKIGEQKQPSNLSKRQMGMLLANIIYSSVLTVFGVEPIVYHDCSGNIVGKRDRDKTFFLYNEYYASLLRNGIDQACFPPDNVRAKRTHSRDNIAYVHRVSL